MSDLFTDRRPTAGATLKRIQIAPSLLAADSGELRRSVDAALQAGARVIHFDVMDGHFVPPITFGPMVVDALSTRVHAAGGVVDVHLMIERPEHQIAAFAGAGADVITIHCEATAHAHYVLKSIHQAGCLAGLALNPATPASVVDGVASLLDVALCMTVNPGWGGQQFIEESLPKVQQLRARLPEACIVEVDGGIDALTAARCVAAGATMLVAGSAVFGQEDIGDAVRTLAAAACADRSAPAIQVGR